MTSSMRETDACEANPEAIVAALLTMLVGGGLLRAGMGRRQ